MRIDHYSTYTFGGAGNGARRLHEGLLQQGISSRFFHREGRPEFDSCPSLIPFANDTELPRNPTKPIKWLSYRVKKALIKRDQKKYIKNRPTGYEVFSTPTQFGETPWSSDLNEASPDVIHLHWVAFWLDYQSFFSSVPKHVPLVWTLHDMNPFTGGCHYSSGCRRYEEGCGSCPQIANSGRNDLSRHVYKQKQRALSGKNLTIVTPSEWLCRLAATSNVFPEGTRYESINLGLDTESFRPLPKQQARQELGLPADAMLVAFGAEDLDNRRKGMPFLWDALDQLETSFPVDALFFGRGKPSKTPSGIRKMHPLGFLSDPHQQRLVYSAADVFVMPSLEDNQPQMGLESMACGTPVVAFDTGGIPEYVLPNETGELAKVGDAKSLSIAIADMLADEPKRLRLGKQSRKHIEANFTLALQADNYRKLYEELLGNSSSSNKLEAKAA